MFFLFRNRIFIDPTIIIGMSFNKNILFVKIFNHHHIQFVHLMVHLPDDLPEFKLMWKLAHDAVLKMFHGLEKEEDVKKKILDD